MITIKSKILKTSLLAGIAAFLAFPMSAQAEMSKEDVQKIVKDYLVKNPEVVVEALDAYRAQQEEKEAKRQKDTISKHSEAFNSDDAPFVGAKDAKITVVEFFDYNCGYCKRAFPDIQALVEKHKDVKVVFQEMPILSPTSTKAAEWALAAHKQGKYFEFHGALMNAKGSQTEDALAAIAKEVGLDVDKAKKDAASQEVKSSISKAAAVAREIGIQGTPAFIVNDELYRGYLGSDGMEKAIEEARAKL